MKKFISLLLTSLFGIREFACMFTLINPSATDVAFGLGSGTANIWNTNPLSVWSNPAKLGYHKNLAFGYSNDSWFENVVWIDFDMYHDNIISELVPEGSGGLPPGVKGAGETNSSGVGYIGRISPFNKINAAGKFYRLDLTAGIYYLNPERTKISYINE
jgi:hypothetical protein